MDKLQEAIKCMIDYQKWRRGDDDIAHPEPKQLGQDIDVVLKATQAYADLPAKIEGMIEDTTLMNSGWDDYNAGRIYTLFEILNIIKEQQK